MTELEKQLEIANQTIKALAINSEDMCSYCKYDTPCPGKECEFYEEGRGLYDKNDKYYDWKWSCMDFDFGTCEKLVNTPCFNCFNDKDYHFKWNGLLV